VFSTLTQKERLNRYDFIQDRAVGVIPIKPRIETLKKNRTISSVKNSRQIMKNETSNFLKTGINEVIMNRQKSSFSRTRFDVSKLERIELEIIEQTVVRQVISDVSSQF
jgi:hypothetical protein